jgi:NAD(P)-dependent dehydrogenase (short-subunit alcohol dehydrogenase family)
MAQQPTAIVTGASRGLGLALAQRLAGDGWRLVIDGRDSDALRAATAGLRTMTTVRDVAGDVRDAGHRGALLSAAAGLGGLRAVVNNASDLGAVPLPRLDRYPLEPLRRALEANVVAPLALVQAALPLLPRGGVVVNVTSDAAREAYPGWGGYGASKAALEQLTAVLAAERPDLCVYAVDPGDMATRMHAEAEPDADPAGLADPAERAGAIHRLLDGDLPSGRYRAVDLLPSPTGAAA